MNLVDRKLNALKFRKQTLIEMNDDYRNFSKGVRNVLKVQKQLLVGVRGTVADLLVVSSPYELAIEVMLGDKLECIITDTEDNALLAIHYLRQRQQGRAAFLPLNGIQGNRISAYEEQRLSEVKGYHGLALDLVTFDPEYREVFTYLLGQLVIVDNLEAAVRCSTIIEKRYPIVTLQGDMIDVGGTLAGGTQLSGRGHKLLSLNRVLTEIDQEIHNIEAQRAVPQSRLSKQL